MIRQLGFIRNCAMATALALTVTAAPAFAATESYLDFDGACQQPDASSTGKGELEKSIKPTLVKVISFKLNPTGKAGVVPKANIGSASGGAGAGKIDATAESLDVTVGPEAADKLLELAIAAKPIPNVCFHIYRNDLKGRGKIGLYLMSMAVVRIVSADWTGGAGDKATTNVTLDFLSKGIQKNTNGGAADPSTVAGGWNRVQNIDSSDIVP